MNRIIKSIDNYLLIKEKDESIRTYLNVLSKNLSVKEIIEIIIKNKSKRKEILLSLDKNKRDQIDKFIEGGIL